MKKFLTDILACPECKSIIKIKKNDDGIVSEFKCSSCSKIYPFFKNKPFLIRKDNELFDFNNYNDSSDSSLQSSKKGHLLIPSLSNNFSFKKTLKQIIEKVDENPNLIILIIGSGEQKNSFMSLFPKHTKFIFSDIDSSANVDFFSDAHDIPLINSSVDIIFTTAVLEHVIDPYRAVEEKYRVLKLNGLIYSEMPFIQQVHEGAYDFTRLTLSGHRRLFNNFDEIDSGICAGPGTALAWTLENFILAFVPDKFSSIKKITKLFARFLFFWIKYFDYILIRDPSNADSSSCTFFIGKKSLDKRSDKSIIESYDGKRSFDHY